MELPITTIGSRRNEDIALDLMKFIASVANIGKHAGSTGFSGATDKKPEDVADQLLELYSRCFDTISRK